MRTVRGTSGGLHTRGPSHSGKGLTVRTHHAGRDGGKFQMVAGNQAQGLLPDTDTLHIKKLAAWVRTGRGEGGGDARWGAQGTLGAP